MGVGGSRRAHVEEGHQYLDTAYDDRNLLCVILNWIIFNGDYTVWNRPAAVFLYVYRLL